MKPFVLIQTRPEDAASDAEYRAFLRFGGLPEDGLTRIRLDRGTLPDLDLDDYSGVIFGGSPYNASDPAEAKDATQVRVEAELGELVREIIARDFPFFGACYGVGTLGVQLGATIDRTYGERPSAIEVSLTPEGMADPVLAGVPPRFDAFVGHKEAASALPEGVTLLASGSACPVQMFKAGQNLYATQFHPELDVPGLVDRLVTYRNEGYFAPDELDDLIAEVSQAEIAWPSLVLANFVRRYARA